MKKVIVSFILTGILAGIFSCASYYYTHVDFNREFEKGDLGKALETLQRDNKLANSKSKFLYYVNNGLLLSILGKYKDSNDYFEKAYLFGEDYQKNYANEAVSYLINPTVKVYPGEDHEHLLLLYYKALNYLKMEKYDDALVECRRLNIRLQQLSDRYSSENKYREDAFIHTLMGIIYETTKDYNNAFIAYRNALNVYDDEYARLFGLQAPEQLKKDLLNTAYRTGFDGEFEAYKTQFGMEDYFPEQPEAELIFFWHNGLSPVKDEWSINFVINHESDNRFVFTNDYMGISFPFEVDDKDDKSNLAKLEVFRVAFPKYVERPEYYLNGTIDDGNGEYRLELAEDINKIAIHSLRERMMLELSKGLLRAALKKATEYSVRKENESLGAVIGLVNAMTERADTRNWQTLPHSILYARVPLKEGENHLTFSMIKGDGVEKHTFTYNVARGQTLFHTFSSLESAGPSGRYY